MLSGGAALAIQCLLDWPVQPGGRAPPGRDLRPLSGQQTPFLACNGDGGRTEVSRRPAHRAIQRGPVSRLDGSDEPGIAGQLTQGVSQELAPGGEHPGGKAAPDCDVLAHALGGGGQGKVDLERGQDGNGKEDRQSDGQKELGAYGKAS